MALKTGTQAPDFSLPSTEREVFQLSKDYAGKPLVLYFYPKDFTRVCTEEACEFRDAWDEFRDLDINIVGISRDSVETHHKFKGKHELPFELLADVQGEVSKLYQATLPLVGMSRRVTYLLDSKHVIRAVYENMFNARKHLKTMMNSAVDLEFQPHHMGKR